MNKIELLSPAQSLEFGKAAINCGADAVYIGTPKFGARAAAGNSIEDIEKLIQYAHIYHARVYVTLNTLLFDNELEEAQEIANKLWNIGADALIIQDMAWLEMQLPPIPLFASTQTHNNTPEKVSFLEKIGIQRAILARELSLYEIADIRKSTNIELEAFVHGAICVSYSGQCYMSHVLTDRSGNRGECAQPCRWLYDLKTSNGRLLEKNKHMLSPKDLRLDNKLKSMIDAGVTSFKIEGRLKNIAYVKNITAWYRQQLDKIIEESHQTIAKSSSGKSIINFTPDPERSFNRGFTQYFINGRTENIASLYSPKSLGKEVGHIINTKGNWIQAQLSEKISNGDGLCFINNDGILEGFRVNIAEGSKLQPNENISIPDGTILYRNHDEEFEKKLEKSIQTRKIEADIKVTETPTGLCIESSDEDNNIVNINFDIEKNIATKAEQAFEGLKNTLKKSGNTPFEVKNVDIQFSQPLFFTSAQSNEMRRQCLELLEKERIKNFKKLEYQIIPNNTPFPLTENSYKLNITNKLSKTFYIRHGVFSPASGAEISDKSAPIDLMTNRYCIKYELGACPKINPNSLLAKEKTLILESHKNRLEVFFDCKKCQMIIRKAQ